MNGVILVVRNNWKYLITFVAFFIISIWFYYIHTFSLDSTENNRQILGSSYQIMAIYGGVIGLFISKKWGGVKSLLGRSIFFFSVSLLFQSLGQSISSYYTFIEKTSLPYPSVGDIGFLGSTFFYIIGIYFLSKASGFKFSFKSIKGKFFSIGIPLLFLIFSYLFFLQGYEYDWTNKLKIFLDFGYPLGDALYVSIALITFILCKNFLGGIMRKPILFFVFALVFQYISDFTFLYQSSRGTWYVGGINDYMYFVSYFLMTMALIYIGNTFNKIQQSE